MPLRVKLTSALRAAADGSSTIEIYAETIDELLGKLIERYPQMANHIEAGIAVSINGEIYRDNGDTPIPADSEVFLLPRIQGG